MCASASAVSSEKTPKNGILYIFSNKKFDKKEDHIGNDADEKRLIETFQHFQFDVQVFKDLTAFEFHQRIRKIYQSNYEEYRHFALAILTHGERHGILWAKDVEYNLDTMIILPILQNKTLKNKLKLFLIEASRGTFDAICQTTDATLIQENYWLGECLRCYADNEGFQVLKGRENFGSYFIQTFCDLLMQYGNTMCITQIMEKTNEEVKNRTGGKQVSCCTSSLTKQFIIGAGG